MNLKHYLTYLFLFFFVSKANAQKDTTYLLKEVKIFPKSEEKVHKILKKMLKAYQANFVPNTKKCKIDFECTTQQNDPILSIHETNDKDVLFERNYKTFSPLKQNFGYPQLSKPLKSYYVDSFAHDWKNERYPEDLEYGNPKKIILDNSFSAMDILEFYFFKKNKTYKYEIINKGEYLEIRFKSPLSGREGFVWIRNSNYHILKLSSYRNKTLTEDAGSFRTFGTKNYINQKSTQTSEWEKLELTYNINNTEKIVLEKMQFSESISNYQRDFYEHNPKNNVIYKSLSYNWKSDFNVNYVD
ncbi:MAG: hypothetical protein K2Q03_03815 [Sphingobacteriaceae bacterium]|nr:hypothetical protein [Sphingobacteriaceae bacterium]